jgi:hypothetical protein
VVIDLYQPLERGQALIIAGESLCMTFKYEKLPAFCFKCGRILHEARGCPISSSKRANHKEGAWGWGSWIRADDLSRALDHGDGSQTAYHHPSLVAAEGDPRTSKTCQKGSNTHSRKSTRGEADRQEFTAPHTPADQYSLKGKVSVRKDEIPRDCINAFKVPGTITDRRDSTVSKKNRDKKGAGKGEVGRARNGPVLNRRLREVQFLGPSPAMKEPSM